MPHFTVHVELDRAQQRSAGAMPWLNQLLLN
jgi:hypothetical protein